MVKRIAMKCATPHITNNERARVTEALKVLTKDEPVQLRMEIENV